MNGAKYLWENFLGGGASEKKKNVKTKREVINRTTRRSMEK